MRVAVDVPKELIELAKKCDFSVIPPHLHDQKLQELAQFAKNYIPKKSSTDLANMKYNDFDLGKCPPKLMNLINQMDFKKVSKVKQMLALPFIENFLRKNQMLK